MTTGIYCLKFKGTNQVYIGKSKNINVRYNIHKNSLRKGLGAKKLQKSI